MKIFVIFLATHGHDLMIEPFHLFLAILLVYFDLFLHLREHPFDCIIVQRPEVVRRLIVGLDYRL